MKYTRLTRSSLLTFLFLGFLCGCAPHAPEPTTRLHLQNISGSPATFLAIGDSKMAVESAANRLPQPLEPNAIYSAVLEGPGMYWVRAEIEINGQKIERIKGPVQLSPGISEWTFTTLYVQPACAMQDMSEHRTKHRHQRAGLMSFSNS